MNILKNILGAFVELNGEAKADKPKASAPVQSNTVKLADDNAIIASSDAAASYQKHFEDVMEAANASLPQFAGTDFKEFIDSKADLDAIADEPAKYRTAFNVLKRTGLTKEKLITTGKEYINIIQKDLDAFAGAYVQQYKTEVESKEQLIQQKMQELQALNDKIVALNKELKEMSGQVTQSKERLNTNKASFMLAGENKKKEIKAELEKIEQYF